MPPLPRHPTPFDPAIYFFVVVPGDGLKDISLMQGFSLSLCEEPNLVISAACLPTNIYDLANDGRDTLIARRMSGAFPVHWFPQSPRAIRALPPSAYPPFSLVILPQAESAADYAEWLKSESLRPALVAASNSELSYRDLTLDGLQSHFLKVCDRLADTTDAALLQQARDALHQWKPLPNRKLKYQVGGHNTVTPNVVTLAVAGIHDLVYGRFEIRTRPGEHYRDVTTKPYVEQIALTTNSIFDERDRVGSRDMYRVYPPPPDLNLFAPSIYPHFFSLKLTSEVGKEEKRRFENVRSAFKRQSGYAFEAVTDAQISAFAGREYVQSGGKTRPQPHPLYFLRAKEQRLATNVMAALSASEFSAVVRLPNDVNRTSGAVRSFAEHYRSYQPNRQKRLKAFQKVQLRLNSSVPRELVDLIRRSTSGVRIVADAHLEWLDLDGLPLCIRKNCSRIPVTPGNLFVLQTSAMPVLHLAPESFSKILVISALKRDDPISGIFETAFAAFEEHWREHVSIEFIEVRNRIQLIDALNRFDGAMVVFDGHGSHELNEPAKLHFPDEAIDIWSLEGHVSSMPPIVVLSACDTHAADRNHATTANGFMLLGARTVLSSVFPLQATSAATFIARLVYRVANFLGAAINVFDRSLSWAEVVSGMIRMQLLTDFLRRLLAEQLITDELYEQVHFQGNVAINRGEANPFDIIISLLGENGLSRSRLNFELASAVSHSSAISYLQIGRPETIVIDDPKRFQIQMEMMLQTPRSHAAVRTQRTGDELI